MPLTAGERTLILSAGQSADQTVRGRAVATVLSKQGDEAEQARRLLAQSYLLATVPSFHLIPRGDAMLPSDSFDDAYDYLAQRTNGFASATADSLRDTLVARPAVLAPLRMIAGLTYNELAVAVELATGTSVTGGALRAYEREGAPPRAGSKAAIRRATVLGLVAETLIDVVNRDVLEVPPPALPLFHSKLDKRDTVEGWKSVERDAKQGVPYSALLYQRYVGGLWRQVQDAYSEVKGDSILELPLATMLEEEGIPFWRSPPGATASSTNRRKVWNRTRARLSRACGEPRGDHRKQGGRRRRDRP